MPRGVNIHGNWSIFNKYPSVSSVLNLFELNFIKFMNLEPKLSKNFDLLKIIVSLTIKLNNYFEESGDTFHKTSILNSLYAKNG